MTRRIRKYNFSKVIIRSNGIPMLKPIIHMTEKTKLMLELEDIDVNRFQTLCGLHNLNEKEFEIISDIGVGISIEEVFERLKAYTKIYADTALIANYASIGADNLFNALMYQAIEEEIEGKEIYLFRQYSQIHRSGLRAHLVDMAFRKNYLYVIGEDEITFEQVDIDKLIKEL